MFSPPRPSDALRVQPPCFAKDRKFDPPCSGDLFSPISPDLTTLWALFSFLHGSQPSLHLSKPSNGFQVDTKCIYV